jgi:multisubunit Na+/H+ antiporter MnhG subunit
LIRFQASSNAGTLGVAFILFGVGLKMGDLKISISLGLPFIFLISTVIAHLFAKGHFMESPDKKNHP